MNEIERKVQEIKLRNKQLRIIYVLAGILIISFFVSVYLYKQQVEITEKTQREKLVLEKVNHELQVKLEENRETSIKQFTNEEVGNILGLLQQVKNNVTDTESKKDLESIQQSIGNLSNIVSDATIISYHKRSADGNAVMEVVNALKNHKFQLDTMPVKDDQGKHKINTLYYGSFVKQEYVNMLLEGLEKKNFKINSSKPFKNVIGEEWKNTAIELVYENNGPEKITPVLLENEEYAVRMYCYNPNLRLKDSISNYLTKEKYQLKTYPDWIKKPSFFSSNPTILYYDASTKAKAEKLTNDLNNRYKQFGLEFTFRKGAGYGITSNERKNTFILHYIDLNQKDVFDLNNSKYIVQLNSYKMEISERNGIYLFLRKYGYQNIEAFAYNKAKPRWMSESSSVLYFSEKSKEKAKELAENLSLYTGRDYKIKKGGNHQKIEPGDEELTFFIHNMKN